MDDKCIVYFAVDPTGEEFCFDFLPYRSTLKEYGEEVWYCNSNYCELPKGTIFKLLGKNLTWDDEPVEYRGDEE